jgi:hypothetical protein
MNLESLPQGICLSLQEIWEKKLRSTLCLCPRVVIQYPAIPLPHLLLLTHGLTHGSHNFNFLGGLFVISDWGNMRHYIGGILYFSLGLSMNIHNSNVRSEYTQMDLHMNP